MAAHAAPTRKPFTFTLANLIAALFQLKLRDKLAAAGGDKSDGAYTWGM